MGEGGVISFLHKNRHKELYKMPNLCFTNNFLQLMLEIFINL